MKLDTKGSIALGELTTDSPFWQSFRLGLKIDIQLLINASTRVKAELVGFDKNQFIILRLSSNEQPFSKSMFAVSTSVVCRFILGDELGKIYAFRSEIINIAAHPFRLLVIRYPDVVQFSSLRSDQRNPVRIPVQVTLLERNHQAELVDLSLRGGLLLFKQDNVALNREQALTLQLNSSLPSIQAIGKSITRPDGKLRLGVQFATPLNQALFEQLVTSSIA